MVETSDAVLMSRVRDGDREAFGVLVHRYQDPIVGYLCRLTGDRDRAEDLAQEAFLRLYEAAPRYREQGRLGAYLYRIATNLLRSEERRAVRHRFFARMVSHQNNGNGNGSGPSPQAEVLTREVRQALEKAIAKLPLRFRAPLVLHEVEGRSCAEVAEVLGCREGTVKSRIHRGRRLLRDALSGYWNGGNGS